MGVFEIMSRGDQRERDRSKRQAKEDAKNGGNKREGTPAQRNQEDAVKLQAKLAAKEAKKAEQDAVKVAPPPTNKGFPIPRKKVAKKTENIDDLLISGLSTASKKNKKK